MGDHYRAYKLDQHGHFLGVHVIEVESDALAVERAEQLMDGHDLELWTGNRLVGRISRAGHQP
jgi:hypothetical protein